MSGDELFVLLISLGGAAWFWGRWLQVACSFEDFGRGRAARWSGVLAPVFALTALWFVLGRFASSDVRDDLAYMIFYLALGGAWLAGIATLAGFCGLTLRDDWLERRNPAAAAAGAGVLGGGIATYAGANIGDGPGWWVVVFSGALASGAWLAGWWIYARLSGAMERITIGRDRDAGLRLGGWLLATGLVAGRAAAGDWHSAGATVQDFVHLAWPLLPGVVVAAVIERRFQSAGRALTASMLAGQAAFSAICLQLAGPWP